MADSTRRRVSASTLLRLLATRETVWLDTPAIAATSAMEGLRGGRRPAVLRVCWVAPSTATTRRPMAAQKARPSWAGPLSGRAAALMFT
ncbi:hypothetical protein Sru01_15570 [Sphaerisporangium rufum]|uniref:Uncharacterized protein n=1 Tax=Sphaerisporangium rufum TaxID=1381558 RepID=A0A919V3S8_9ACTN|nr:hypothetical protein Sru01_15570 [Sphaerisporangium rufum]